MSSQPRRKTVRFRAGWAICVAIHHGRVHVVAMPIDTPSFAPLDASDAIRAARSAAGRTHNAGAAFLYHNALARELVDAGDKDAAEWGDVFAEELVHVATVNPEPPAGWATLNNPTGSALAAEWAAVWTPDATGE